MRTTPKMIEQSDVSTGFRAGRALAALLYFDREHTLETNLRFDERFQASSDRSMSGDDVADLLNACCEMHDWDRLPQWLRSRSWLDDADSLHSLAASDELNLAFRVLWFRTISCATLPAPGALALAAELLESIVHHSPRRAPFPSELMAAAEIAQLPASDTDRNPEAISLWHKRLTSLKSMRHPLSARCIQQVARRFVGDARRESALRTSEPLSTFIVDALKRWQVFRQLHRVRRTSETWREEADSHSEPRWKLVSRESETILHEDHELWAMRAERGVLAVKRV